MFHLFGAALVSTEALTALLNQITSGISENAVVILPLIGGLMILGIVLGAIRSRTSKSIRL